MTSKKLILLLIAVVIVVAFVIGLQKPITDTKTAHTSPAQEKTLRVGITPTSPPLIFHDGKKIAGLEIDLAKGLSRHLDRKLEFVELSWEDQIPALLDRRTDIIMAGMSVTPTREVRVAFSQPYLKFGQMALARKTDLGAYNSVKDVFHTKGKVGIERETTGDDLVQRQCSQAKAVVAYTAVAKAVDDLITGQIDLVVHDAPVILWLASQRGAEGVAPVPHLLTQEHMAWGVRPKNDKLLREANEFLSLWEQNGKLKQAIAHWMPYAR